MALVPCPECGSEVSDRAPTCPRCGFRLRPSLWDRLSWAWGEGLSLAQRGAVAYPVTWLAVVILSLAFRDELNAFGEIFPSLLVWIVPVAVFGFVASALAILLVAWLKGWLGKGASERSVWSRSSLAVAITWVIFTAWLILTM